VIVQSADTTTTRTVTSNQRGEYSVPALLPGPLNITVEANGFKTLHQNGVVVEVDQRARLDFVLTVGSKMETITVPGSAPLLNTSDASVSTLVANQFVENLPLNGRSFSSLIDLTPGVVLAASGIYEQGQFSVNGQRPDANYFLVDGVSANLGNVGAGSTLYQGGAGQLPVTSALGGMSNLVSLDALEEFRIQTSTFAPEYGRTPGAQVSVVTKSGTNAFHGTAFEYLRNDKLDANDWFANADSLARPELRQNDFGGVLDCGCGSLMLQTEWCRRQPRYRVRPQPCSRCSPPSRNPQGRTSATELPHFRPATPIPPRSIRMAFGSITCPGKR
jgi:hypothetical protein